MKIVLGSEVAKFKEKARALFHMKKQFFWLAECFECFGLEIENHNAGIIFKKK